LRLPIPILFYYLTLHCTEYNYLSDSKKRNALFCLGYRSGAQPVGDKDPAADDTVVGVVVVHAHVVGRFVAALTTTVPAGGPAARLVPRLRNNDDIDILELTTTVPAGGPAARLVPRLRNNDINILALTATVPAGGPAARLVPRLRNNDIDILTLAMSYLLFFVECCSLSHSF
jgi:hypothetical protein